MLTRAQPDLKGFGEKTEQKILHKLEAARGAERRRMSRAFAAQYGDLGSPQPEGGT